MKNLRILTGRFYSVILAGLFLLALPNPSLAQVNPCAPKAKKAGQNPCAVNPCAVKNPCAANPCSPGRQSAGAGGKAITVRGEVARVEAGSGRLALKVDGKLIELTLNKYSVVRAGAQVKRLADVKPGEKVTVSYVESGKERMAWYVYLGSGAVGANPCAAKNPCAGNPCAPKAKKAK